MSHLAAAVADLLAGRLSVVDARDRAAELPDLDDVDEWLSDLGNLLESVQSATDPARAADLATVAEAAVGYLEEPPRVSILLQIGAHLMELKNWSAALPFFSAVTDRDDASNGPGPYYLHFDILRQLGRDEEALELVPKVIAQATQRPAVQVEVLMEQALLLRRHGRLADAIQSLNEAVAARRAVPDGESGPVPPVHDLLLRLGDYARTAGQLDDAISAFEQARAAALAAGAADRAAFALSELGYTYRNSGEADRGIELLKAAATEALQVGRIDDAVRWDADLKGIELPEGEESSATKLQRAANLVESDPAKAVTIARECVKLGVQAGNSLFEAEARNIVAAGLSNLGHRQEAWLAYRAALIAATRSGDLMAQFHVLGNLADLRFRQMKKTEFDQVSAEAIRVGEQVRRTAGTGETPTPGT